MKESFIFAVNTVVPIFVIVLLGGILKKSVFSKTLFLQKANALFSAWRCRQCYFLI